MNIALFALSRIACAGLAHAGIIGTGGDTEWIATPADARLNALTNDKVVRVWKEQQKISPMSSLDADIIGVIVRGDDRSDSRDRLDQSDWLSVGTLYSNGVNNRGLELSSKEFVEISADRRTLSLAFHLSSPGDYVRVTTRAVPPRGSFAIVGMGVLVTGRRCR